MKPYAVVGILAAVRKNSGINPGGAAHAGFFVSTVGGDVEKAS
jgi:hypothetical protein